MKSPAFTALGGTLGIDFINTVQHHRGQTVNLLNTPTPWPDGFKPWPQNA